MPGQLALPLPDNGLPKRRTTQAQAAYHLHRDVPAHLAGNPGDIRPTLPTPTENGVFMRQHEIGAEREVEHPVQHHPAERNKYPNVPGQQVIGPPHNPQQFGELDAHGNVYHEPTKREEAYIYQKHGPFMSDHHEAWWQRHSTPQDVSTSAPVHTMQSVQETGTHSYIAGPMRPGGTPTSILIHRGIPWVADGHHRMQEARGRGEATFPARVVNLDQMHEAAPVLPKVAKKAPGHEVVEHLMGDHKFKVRSAEGFLPNAVQNHGREHDRFPVSHFHGHVDRGPSYGGLGAPEPKEGFTDSMNPAQHDWDQPPSREAAKKASRGRNPVI